MTDIQRHLKPIRKLLAQTLEEGVDLDMLRQRLRDELPGGYGVMAGLITGTEGQPIPADIIIYDVPRAGTVTNTVHIDHVLLIIEVAASHTIASFEQVLAHLASIKAMRTPPSSMPLPRELRPKWQRQRKVPKYRLPYGLVYFHYFDGIQTSDESFFANLSRMITVHPSEYRPDEIDIPGHIAQYFHPSLDHDILTPFDVGLSQLPNLVKPQPCYVCKGKYSRRHFFYESLCLRCSDLNYHKRTQTVDLRGYIALVTGARVKIGYETTLRLLRCGAEVITTSRFPRDAARRFALEHDFETWCHRLHVYGLDLRQITRLESFISHLYQRYSHLDILINNAAQTVKRPPAYYAHLLPFETAPVAELPAHLIPVLRDDAFETSSALMSNPDDELHFPAGKFDEHGQQIDNRPYNSWVMTLDEVPVAELLEVHLINAVAPAVLAGQLKDLMQRSPHPHRFIINVSAAEGRFAAYKQGYHPHTNMAKAALNMLTRSIALDYSRSRIYVNSVDPGWVSDQVPRTDDLSRSLAAERLPIDMMDAAARICDPIFTTITTQKSDYGRMLKDYQEVEW